MNDMFRQADGPEALASKKTLRPHQTKAINLVKLSLGKGLRRVVIQAATGFGKTLLASKIIEGALSKDKRVIFTAPAVSLIDQTVEAFEAEGIRGIGVMQANHPRTDKTAKVQVASVQTLARREIPEAALVIIDECHIRAKVVERLMTERPDVFFIGLSATPWAKGMGLLWQDMVTPCEIGDLIEAGYLSKFRVFAPDIPDMSGVKTVAGDYSEAGSAEVMEGNALMASVVETWLEKGENRPTLLFGVNCAHARQLFEAFLRAGVAAAYCDAYTDSVERKLIERRFRAGEIKICCSVRTLTTGIDWPVSCIVDAAPTKSIMLHVQKIGRGLRVNEGTEDCVILDHAGNSLRLGLVTDIHRTELDTTKPGEKPKAEPTEKLPKECANCAALHTGLTCPFCGHERKPVAGVETVDGILVEIGTKKSKEPTKADKQRFWSMALWLDDSRRKGGRLAKGLYKGAFGVWPRGLSDTRVPGDKVFMNYEVASRIRYAKRMAKKENA
jgi:superfamily II DNA or RNA helicase